MFFRARLPTLGTSKSREPMALAPTTITAIERYTAAVARQRYGELVELARERSGRYAKSNGPTERP